MQENDVPSLLPANLLGLHSPRQPSLYIIGLNGIICLPLRKILYVFLWFILQLAYAYEHIILLKCATSCSLYTSRLISSSLAVHINTEYYYIVMVSNNRNIFRNLKTVDIHL